MNSQDEVFLFLSPDVNRFLSQNDIGARELVQKAGLQIGVRLGENPAINNAGEKEPATVLLASAAVIAALTPILRDLMRNLSGREAVVRERRLLPVEDSKGDVIRDASGAVVLHWVDVVKGQASEHPSQPIKIKGLGIEISFGGK
jgi:hypothetical protein